MRWAEGRKQERAPRMDDGTTRRTNGAGQRESKANRMRQLLHSRPVLERRRKHKAPEEYIRMRWNQITKMLLGVQDPGGSATKVEVRLPLVGLAGRGLIGWSV